MNWSPKFTGLVCEKRLWMSSLSTLEQDMAEGKTPQIITQELQDALANAENDEVRENINKDIDIIRNFAAEFYPHYYVSCWTMSDVERDLMWRAYTAGTEAVAVQTTFERLRRSLPDYLDIGRVRYIDYRKQGFGRLNMLEWPMHKRVQFYDDQEVRILANTITMAFGNGAREHLFESEDKSIIICAPPIDLSTLIEAIYFHPSADKAFTTKATEFCKTYGLPIPRSSEIAEIFGF